MNDDKRLFTFGLIAFGVILFIALLQLFLLPLQDQLPELSVTIVLEAGLALLISVSLLYFTLRGLPFLKQNVRRHVGYLFLLGFALVFNYALTDLIENFYQHPDLLKALLEEGALLGGALALALAIRAWAKENQRQQNLLKRSNRELEEGRESFSTLINNAPDCIFIKDKEGRYQLVNRELEELFDAPAEEIIGKTDRDLSPTDAEAEDFRRDDEAALKSGEKQINEEEITDAQGNKHWFQTKKVAINYRGEKSVLGITREITRRKKMEEEIKARERELESIFEATRTVSLIKTDLNSVIEEFSSGAEEIFGYESEEVIGRHVAFLHTEESSEELSEYVERLRRGKEGFTIETNLVRKSGEKFPALFSVQPVLNEDEEITGTLGITVDITEQKQREQRLKATEQRLSLALDGTDTGVWEWNLETDEVIWSESMERLFGLDPGSFEGTYEAFAKFVHPDDRPVLEEEIEQTISTGETFQTQYRIKSKTGGQKWGGARADLVEDVDGTRRMIGIVTDITEQKRKEEAVKEARQRLRQIIDLLPQLIWAKDSKGKYILANEAVADAYGVSVDQLEGMKDIDLASNPEEARQFRRDDLEIIESGEPKHIPEEPLTDADGETRYVQTTKIPYSPTDSDKQAVLGVAFDITKRKELTDQLRANEQFLRNLSQISASISKNCDGKIDEFLELGREHLGMSFARVAKMKENEFEIILAQGLNEIPENSTLLLEEKGYCQMTFERNESLFLSSAEQVIETVGSELYEKFQVNTYAGEPIAISNEPWGVVCFGRVETRGEEFSDKEKISLRLLARVIQAELEQKYNLERINRTRSEAEEANRAKSQFLARMSHEIRTPLNAIMGMADLLAETELNNEQSHYVDVFQNSSEILVSLINDILDLSKIEAGELKLHEDYFSPEALAVETTEFFAQKAHELGLELNVYVDPDCPPEVLGDRDRLRQVLVNLLSNAIKFTEVGEVNLNLHVEEREAEEVKLRFEVEDSGIGISESDQENIFEEFVQADESSSRRHQGTGLGLNISWQLVNKMGGMIDLESQPGEGSKFYFELSLPWRDSAPEKVTEPAVTELEGLTVLAVDDNETNLEIVAKYLEANGIEVTVNTDPREALNQLSSEPLFDVILLDYQMPGLDGFEVVDSLPESYQPKSVVMLSSDDLSETRRQAEAKGIGDYLVKPVGRCKLEKTLLRLVQKETGSGEIEPGEAIEEEVKLLQGSVLLAEDNANNRLVVNSYLSSEEIEIETALNGQEAYEKLQKKEYDLVLMDLEMPVMDGYEATSRFRQWEAENRESRQPIMALTAHAMEGARDKALEHGCDDYLAKPVKKQALRDKLAQYLNEG